MTGYDGHRVAGPAGTDHGHTAYSALLQRPPLVWPGGAGVALVVNLQVEAALPQVPAGTWAPPGSPAWLDVSAWSLHEYGRRVGVHRFARILDELGLRATMPVSDLALQGAPELVELALERGWELVGHGAAANLLVTSALSEDEERDYLAASRRTILAASGIEPRGWAGPEWSESHRTPALAAEVGYDYLLDWGHDDQPVATTHGSLVSVPVAVDTSDHLVLAAGSAQTPWDFGAALQDQLDGLLDGPAGAVLTVTLRAHLSGQPFRARYVRDFLAAVVERSGVWPATAAEVVDAFRRQQFRPRA
jgi:peptidoglycan/xylan/chitin deacetylase (PgdA/CDA1 family)